MKELVSKVEEKEDSSTTEGTDRAIKRERAIPKTPCVSQEESKENVRKTRYWGDVAVRLIGGIYRYKKVGVRRQQHYRWVLGGNKIVEKL